MQPKLQIPDHLKTDFTWLENTHGMNDIMLESLLASKAEARAHIRFFKRMVFISNGVFVRGVRSVQAVERISKKHGLI